MLNNEKSTSVLSVLPAFKNFKRFSSYKERIYLCLLNECMKSCVHQQKKLSKCILYCQYIFNTWWENVIFFFF